MVQYKVHVDYLSITGKLDKGQGDEYQSNLLSRANLASRLLEGLGITNPALQTVPPARYYEVSFVDRYSEFRVNLGSDLSAQGWQVVVGGRGCVGFDPHKSLKSFLEVWRGKVTRCDVAIDLIDSGITPESVADEYREAHGSDGRRNWSFIKGKTGDTCYIGSRASDRMLRVYDKGAEQGIPVDWLRVEMEYKGGYAQHACETYLYDYRNCVADAADFISLPASLLVSSLRKIAMGKIAEKRSAPKTVTDRVKWFNGQVLQSYFKLCEDEPEEARLIWVKFHDIWLAHEVWGMFNRELDKVVNGRVELSQ